ncbi:fluoride efflux transporter FluC [Actinorugispora endophytica]|uniref:Fluoride-specific ion channel FluC n=1 Tax=Actinorugispora endophytica TaxID=1605990 RepID=A0A4R6V837_9ACTN|nr:CrcB family protein [Actinorugispora endophytica]TDQ55296.1 CrcB protein [Actinorugispora endophytica]
MTVLMVALGAAVGAPLRYFVDRFVQARHDSVFPWGTHVVNATSCLLLGFAGALALPPWATALAGTGFLGALSTYSTFGYETFRLLENRETFLACANVLASLGAGLGAAVIGAACGRALLG